jgi:hypothetical protein
VVGWYSTGDELNYVSSLMHEVYRGQGIEPVMVTVVRDSVSAVCVCVCECVCREHKCSLLCFCFCSCCFYFFVVLVIGLQRVASPSTVYECV